MTKDKNATPDVCTVRIDGEDYALRITLGGLAALERKLGVKNIKELGQRLEDPSMGDILEVALVAIRCGGEQVPDDFFMTAECDMSELSKAIGEALKRTMTGNSKPSRGNVKAA
jgi:hypothetical protein